MLQAVRASTQRNISKLINELKECRDLVRAKVIHESAVESGDATNVYVASTLIHTYAKCGSMHSARKVFNGIGHPNVVSWTTLMLGYVDNGESFVALELFSEMRLEACLPDARTFVAAIKACTELGLCFSGKILHLLAAAYGFDAHTYVQVTLMDMYAKCGCMKDARAVFDGIKDPTAVSWNALILGYATSGEPEVALALFSRLKEITCEPNSRTFVAAVKACIENEESLVTGKALELLSLRICSSDIYLQDVLISMYCNSVCMDEACRVFENIQHPSVVTWNTLIMGYVDVGKVDIAFDLLRRMKLEGFQPNSRTFIACFKSCTKFAGSEETMSTLRARALQLHMLLLRAGCGFNVYVQGTLVDMYSKLGDMVNAYRAFDKMHSPGVASWTAIIQGYAEAGESNMALSLLIKMKEEMEPDARTFVSALKACTELEELDLKPVEVIHLLALRSGFGSDIYVQGSLVDVYARLGSMQNSRKVFDSMKNPDVPSWNALISGYVENAEGCLALGLFSKMNGLGCAPNARTLVAALKACIELSMLEVEHVKKCAWIERGKQLHLLASRLKCTSDSYLQSTLVDFYAKCNCLKNASAVFESIQHPNVVAWTSLILGYVDNGDSESALVLFLHMRSKGCLPNSRTIVAALKACRDLAAALIMEVGKPLHLLASIFGFDSDVYVLDSLVDMYGKSGAMELAHRVFDTINHPNVVSWNALLFGYVDNGDGATALDLFTKMKRESYVPDERTFVAALKACSSLGALETGATIHADILKRGLQNDVALGNCLIDFYGKCGSLNEAKQVFNMNGTRNLVSWTTLMTGYCRQGSTTEVFNLFHRMCDIGLVPNEVTLLCVLTACSHAGLDEKGVEFFRLMFSKYGMTPGVEHYNCMIDMLGRRNKLDEAMVLLRNMPSTGDEVAWMTVLGACRKWKNLGLGILAFETLVSLERTNAAAFVLMANIYGNKGMWKEQAALQSLRKSLGIWKRPGQSLWTSKSGVVNTFFAGDKSHPQNHEIEMKLNDLILKIRDHGYVPDLSSVAGNLTDIEKEDALCGHSEKLAIACALNNTKPGETIRIIKNLRVCVDCHIVTGMISKVEGRTILCRDASRYHVFKDGICSCNGFW